jgi:short-chain fatty acids transporter
VRVGLAARRGLGRLTPEPLVIAALLTALVAAASFVWVVRAGAGASGPALIELLERWRGGQGLWGLLSFAMQASLMLVLGSALAATPPLRRLLRWLVGLPRGARALVAMTACVSIVAALLNWSLGLVCGALFARGAGEEAARRGWRLDYPLLCAAGYAGMMTWHGGLSGTAPLKATNPRDTVEVLGAALAAEVGTIPLSESLFSWLNLAVSGGLLILGPLIFAAMTPREGEDPGARSIPIGMADEAGLMGHVPAAGSEDPALGRLERSRVITWLLAAPMIAALVLFGSAQGWAALDLNTVNLGLWAAALLLHGRPDRFVAACEAGIRGCAGIMLLFPLYAGMMGLLAASGLSAALAGLFADVPGRLFTAATFASAGLLNLFVPSGGGQWALQGPIVIEAALARGVDPGAAMMAVAYGDQWTNMLQPFWAAPLLAITGARAREIAGYCAVWMALGGLWIVGVLLAWGTGSPGAGSG